MARSDDARRALPAVDALLSHPRVLEAAADISHNVIVLVARRVLEEIRASAAGGKTVPSAKAVAETVAARLRSLRASGPRRVINATGVVLHTGLGRAPLCGEAVRALQTAAGYCDLELDLDTGERGDRQSHVEAVLCALTGAESALVVNNNAAAIYLTLNVLAYRREVIVSRGQLIEIGGSFRLPEIMVRAGVRLIEVGTTNRTRVEDYCRAVSPKTALLMRAHPSNYRIVGFTQAVPLESLVSLGKKHTLPVVDDIGNGLLWDWSRLGLPAEENASASIEAGADLVLMSSDKVLGGPQAGIILGARDLVQRLKENPLARVLRPEKLTIAALAATLQCCLDREAVAARIPVWKMLTCNREELAARAQRICARLAPLGRWQLLEVRACESEAGSGTLPTTPLPSTAVCTLPAGMSASRWARTLRLGALPVVATVRQEAVWLDVRTIADADEEALVEAITEALREK